MAGEGDDEALDPECSYTNDSDIPNDSHTSDYGYDNIRVTLDFGGTLISWKVRIVDYAANVPCAVLASQTTMEHDEALSHDMATDVDVCEEEGADDDDDDAESVSDPSEQMHSGSGADCGQHIEETTYPTNITKLFLAQSVVRMHLERRRYLSICLSTIKIQSLVRMRIQRHKFLALYQKLVSACVLVQSYYRMYQRRKSYAAARIAAVKIQTAFRAFLEQRRHLLRLAEFHRSECNQVSYRTMLTNICRQRQQQLSTAAIAIQSLYRGYRERSLRR